MNMLANHDDPPTSVEIMFVNDYEAVSDYDIRSTMTSMASTQNRSTTLSPMLHSHKMSMRRTIVFHVQACRCVIFVYPGSVIQEPGAGCVRSIGFLGEK
jgi:hypothetical protein